MSLLPDQRRKTADRLAFSDFLEYESSWRGVHMSIRIPSYGIDEDVYVRQPAYLRGVVPAFGVRSQP